MRWRYVLWAVVILAAAGFAAVMIPGSPLALEKTFGDPMTEDIPDDMPLAQLTDPNRVKKEKPLRAWTADLSSPDRAVRLSALNAINRIAPLAATAALPVAKVMADDPDVEVKRKASHVLYRIGTGAKPALDQATAALAADDAEVRRNATLFMMSLKTDARPAVPALIKAMNDPRNDVTLGNNETTQVVAASALGGVSTGTAEAVPALTEVVASNRPDLLRGAAARALGMIGEPAKPAVPAMYAFLAAVKDLDLKEDVTEALRLLKESPPDVAKPKTNMSKYSQSKGGDGEPPPAAGGPAKK